MATDVEYLRLNTKSICRTCYETSHHLHPLHERTEQFPLKSLADLLLDVARIHTEPLDEKSTIPNQLCSNCTRKLKNAYTFIIRAQATNDKLIQFLKDQPGSDENAAINTLEDCLSETPIDIPSNASAYIKTETDYDNDSLPLPTEANDDIKDVVSNDAIKSSLNIGESLSMLPNNPNENVFIQKDEYTNEIQDDNMNTTFVDPITITESNKTLRISNDFISNTTDSNDECEKRPIRRRGRPRLAKNISKAKGHQYSCEHCDETFALKKDLSRHLECHHIESQFECEMCSQKFLRKDQLKDHIKTHKKSIDDKSQSHMFGKRSRNSEWSFAERLYSNQRFTKIECKLCDSIFESTNLLRSHLLCHESDSTIKISLNSDVVKEFYPQTIQDINEIKLQITKDIAEKRFRNFYAILNEYGYEMDLSDSDDDDEILLSKYQCEICYEKFPRKFLTIGHIKDKHIFEKMPYKCAVCKVEFVCEYMFEIHARTQCKNKEKKYQCLKCPGKFMWVENLENHRCSNRFNRPEYKAQLPKKRELLQCNVCDKTFVWRKDLKRHRETHDPNGTSHECSICYQRFLKAENLRQHLRHTHEQLRRRIECCLCGETFDKLYILRAHLKQHEAGLIAINKEGLFFKVYYPDEIGQSFDVSEIISNDFAVQKLARFYSAVDESGNELDLNDSESDTNLDESYLEGFNSSKGQSVYKCEICLQEFKRRKIVLQHQFTEHGSEQVWPYICDNCNKKFVCYELLQQHRSSDCNNEYKKFQCTKCSSRFVWEENLRIHLNIKHIDPEQQISRKLSNKLQCDECEKTFIWPKDLHRHRRCHLPDDEKFECPVCPRRFNRKDNMQAHLKVHGTISGLTLETKKHFFKNNKQLKVEALDENMCKPNGCKVIQCMICSSKHAKIVDLRTHLRTHRDNVSLSQHKTNDIVQIALQFYPNEVPTAEENILIERIKADITENRLERFYSITNEVGNELDIDDSETDSDSEVEEDKKAIRNLYSCGLCGELFSRKYKLLHHQNFSHTWAEIPYICEICNVRFVTEKFLEIHYRTQCKNPYKRFNCKKCPLRFMWKDNLKMHERTVHAETEDLQKFDANRYECQECNRTFAWQKDLTRHLIYHQSESTIFNCAWCPRKFYTKETLHMHIKRHGVTPQCLAATVTHIQASSGPNGKKTILCKCCNIQLTSISELRSHLRTHFDDTPFNEAALQMECSPQLNTNSKSLANYSITNQLGFELDLDDSESGDEDSVVSKPEGVPLKYTCELCSREFVRKYEISQHQRDVHQYEQMPRKCDKCIFKTLSKEVLEHHMRTQCYNLEKKFQCNTCSFKFMWQENLIRHIERMHPDDELQMNVDLKSNISDYSLKQFQCNMCNCKYNRKDRLNAHLRKAHMKCDDEAKSNFSIINAEEKVQKSTTIQKKFLCAFCGRAVTSSSNLIIHMRRHTGEKPFKCDFCDMAFPRSSDLQCHRRTHTGEKPHKCTICDKAFSRSYKLQTHMRIHSGERPYKCTYCEKSFTQSNDLTLHIRRHTGERPYVCGVCGERFIQGTALKNHRMIRGHYEEAEPQKLTILEQF